MNSDAFESNKLHNKKHFASITNVVRRHVCHNVDDDDDESIQYEKTGLGLKHVVNMNRLCLLKGTFNQQSFT